MRIMAATSSFALPFLAATLRARPSPRPSPISAKPSISVWKIWKAEAKKFPIPLCSPSAVSAHHSLPTTHYPLLTLFILPRPSGPETRFCTLGHPMSAADNHSPARVPQSRSPPRSVADLFLLVFSAVPHSFGKPLPPFGKSSPPTPIPLLSASPRKIRSEEH